MSISASLIIAVACITLFFYLRSLLINLLFKYMDRIASMPVMKWIPFGELRYAYFDNSGFWAQMMLLALMKGKAIEARLMEGFEGEGIENPTYEKLQFRAHTMEMYEFRLNYRPRRKRKIKLMDREWFDRDPVLQPV